MCLAQGPQRNDADEARTRGPSVSSQALYHWAAALPDSLVPVNSFKVIWGRVFLGWTSTKQWIKCLPRVDNAVPPVRLEPATPRSRVRNSTTEPRRYYWRFRLPPIRCGFAICLMMLRWIFYSELLVLERRVYYTNDDIAFLSYILCINVCQALVW